MTVQPSTFVLTTDDKIPTLRKIKRAALPTHKLTQNAAQLVPTIRDLILPNRTSTLRTFRTKTRQSEIHFADLVRFGNLFDGSTASRQVTGLHFW